MVIDVSNPIIYAIIPARAGSKGIPKKNIVELGGKPLIAWTIQAAQEAENVQRVIVSTDSKEIRRIALEAGGEVPFLRPEEIAQDQTPGITPALHAIEWLKEHEDQLPDYIAYLQPTSPFRTATDINRSIRLATSQNADSVVSVVKPKHHPNWSVEINEVSGKLLDPPELKKASRRQDLSSVFALNGAIYLAKSQLLLEKGTWYTARTFAYIMPPERSLDIDNTWDLYLGELIMRDGKSYEFN